jgi:TatD DNase family protein
MIDSHCHLAGEEFAADLEAVADRARAAGVDRLLVILAAEADAEFARVEAVRAAWPGVRFGIGVHPHHAQLFADDPERAARLARERLDATAGAVAIGEIGLDYHYDFSPREAQQAVFRAQLRLARALDLPVILHTREADDDTLGILAEEGGVLLRGVFHCFTGGRAFAERAVATGFYVSFSGIATFPAAGSIREAVRVVPADRILVETDAPYLAPPPHRGKRNEPAWVTKVAEVVARERGVAVAELAAGVTANFDRLFAREHRPQSPALQ